LAGAPVGVFVGINPPQYGLSVEETTENLEGYLGTGSAASVASGRISYTFGFEGPAITVDTACSSSLVAMHLAVQALRNGECETVLTGGTSVMTAPRVFTEFSRQRGVAPDGRCKAFAAAADGMGLAEGVGMVVLERLSDARRNGHEVLAVVRGSAVNQDGASNGLTAPNGPSQQRVIRAALANAGLVPGDVDAVEAHGTGTSLGDPIEAQALLATYGQERPEGRPLWLGSVKSNIGHTQAAAGVAGVIKMVQAMRHGVLPRTLHIDEPTPEVDWESGAVSLLTEAVEWPDNGRPRRAGVSSFGVSGTNAHLILEQASEDASGPGGPRSAVSSASGEDTGAPLGLWVVSGRSDEALRAQAGRLAEHVRANPDLDPVDVGYSLATTRAHHAHRAVVTGATREELLAGLDALTQSRAAGDLVQGIATGHGGSGGTVLVFPGQGSQWVGMGVDLYESSVVFRERMDACAAALKPFTGWDLLDVLRGGSGALSLERVDVVQPALFAVMVSLARLWEAQGVVPDAVIGHSQGEIAAAFVCGALSLEDAARVVALRSRIIGEDLAGHGGMVSVPLAVEEAEGLIGPWSGRLGVAAVNGPSATVVSGEAGAVEEFLAVCEGRGVRARRVPVDYASHSAAVEAIRERLLEDLAPIVPRSSQVPFFSTLRDEVIDTAGLDAQYWFENLRHPVGFHSGIRTLLESGHSLFVEVSAHPVLTIGVQETVDEAEAASAVVVPSLRRDEGGAGRFLSSLGAAHVGGAAVDWDAVFTGLAGSGRAPRRVDLPTYAFQHQHYWIEDERAGAGIAAVPPGDSVFWEAVEGRDAKALAAELGVNGEVQSSLDTVLPALSEWRQRQREQSTVQGWRYDITWKRCPDPGPVHLDGTWLVLSTEAAGDIARGVTDALARNGVRTLSVTPDSKQSADPSALAERLRAVFTELSDAHEELPSISGVVSLLGMDEGSHPDHPVVRVGLAATVNLLRALPEAGVDAPVWVVTRGAVSTGSVDVLDSPVQALVWGLGRVAALEYPERWGGLVDLPARPDGRALDRLCAVVSGLDGEDQVAVRASGVHVRRLVRASRPAPGAVWRSRDTALITGGTGGLGARLARWLVGNGTGHVVLTSRRGPEAPGAEELRAELEALGARVTIAACDAADREALAGLMERVDTPESPLRTVAHTAGVVRTETLARTSLEEIADIFSGKTAGADNLVDLVNADTVDTVLLYSSMSGVWGVGEHAAYAAANAYLDALAHHCRDRGIPATSIAWGSWGEGGMIDDAAEAILGRQGLVTMSPESALAGLAGAVGEDRAFLGIADIDWERFTATFTVRRPSPLLRDLPDAREDKPGPDEERPEEHALIQRLLGLSEDERQRALVELVRSHAAVVLGHGSPREIAPDRPFQQVGFDSLAAVELRNRLRNASGLRLTATVVFDHPTPTELAQHLGQQLAPSPRNGKEELLKALRKMHGAVRETSLTIDERGEAMTLLQGIISSLDGPGEGGETASVSVVERIDSATDEEMFSFIDEEL
ncbi:type I polyketide synthase, partial [Nocardiopsis synnemataformans]|uniref:type I polyketide synthase n=1 Tax=Nocardiopsis synnemataformans TaxID=61305 RepID=UPI003EBFC87D